MATLKNAYAVNSSTPRGYGLIFTNAFKGLPYWERKTAREAEKDLTDMFVLFGLEVRIYRDCQKPQAITILEELSQNPNLEKHSLFFAAFSTPSDATGEIIFSNIESRLTQFSLGQLDGAAHQQDAVSIHNLVDMFSAAKCPLLKGKPKVFIFNGVPSDKLSSLHDSPAESDDVIMIASSVASLPSKSFPPSPAYLPADQFEEALHKAAKQCYADSTHEVTFMDIMVAASRLVTPLHWVNRCGKMLLLPQISPSPQM